MSDGRLRHAEAAHPLAVGAAIEGMRDPALGAGRLSGPGIRLLADAAVTSATPFVRAPLLGLIHEALLLHGPASGTAGEDRCATCGTPDPCATVRVLSGASAEAPRVPRVPASA